MCWLQVVLILPASDFVNNSLSVVSWHTFNEKFLFRRAPWNLHFVLSQYWMLWLDCEYAETLVHNIKLRESLKLWNISLSNWHLLKHAKKYTSVFMHNSNPCHTIWSQIKFSQEFLEWPVKYQTLTKYTHADWNYYMPTDRWTIIETASGSHTTNKWMNKHTSKKEVLVQVTHVTLGMGLLI
jgi:hypothetical protein